MMATRSLRTFARIVVARRLIVRVEGLEHVPDGDPVVIAARHYHHLHDAAVLLAVIGRPVQILVALDWVRARWGRHVMEWACRTAGWPFVLRGDSPHLQGAPATSAYRPEESLGIARRAVRDATELLAAGGVLLVFPEGYPVIDPEGSRRAPDDEIGPFRPGFARLVARVRRTHGLDVPVIPVGVRYRPGEHWQITVRFGRPVHLCPDADLPTFVRRIEAEVRRLSG